MATTFIHARGYFCVTQPPARLVRHYLEHPEELSTDEHFDYYSPDNCPDILSSSDSDSDDDMDYEYAKLGFF